MMGSDVIRVVSRQPGLGYPDDVQLVLTKMIDDAGCLISHGPSIDEAHR